MVADADRSNEEMAEKIARALDNNYGIVDYHIFYDRGLDLDMYKVTYFDPLLNKFVSKEVMNLDQLDIPEANEETKQMYKKWVQQKMREDKQNQEYVESVKSLRCPDCHEDLKVVGNRKFLWLMHNKCGIPAPYTHSIKVVDGRTVREAPKGSTGDQFYVTFCPECKVNYTYMHYHRITQVKKYKDLKLKKEVRLDFAQDGLRTKNIDY